MIVVVRTTLVCNMAMAVVGLTSGFLRKLLVGNVLHVILVRFCCWWYVFLSRALPF